MPANPPPLDAAARTELARKAKAVKSCGCTREFDVSECVHDMAFIDACSPDVILALLASVRGAEADTRDADEQTRAAWRAQDITHAHMERFANEATVADLLFDYFADWLDWGTLTIRRQCEGEEPVTADLVVGPDETFRDALLRRALAEGTPGFTAKLLAALAPRQPTGDEHG